MGTNVRDVHHVLHRNAVCSAVQGVGVTAG